MTSTNEMHSNGRLNLWNRLVQNNRLLVEIFTLILKRRKWWLIPIFIVFSIFSFLFVMVGGSSILPAIYALF